MLHFPVLCPPAPQVHSIFSNIEAALAGRSFVPAWDRACPADGQPLLVAGAVDCDSGTEGEEVSTDAWKYGLSRRLAGCGGHLDSAADACREFQASWAVLAPSAQLGLLTSSQEDNYSMLHV